MDSHLVGVSSFFAAASVFMVLMNKAAVSCSSQPGALLVLQNLTSLLLALAADRTRFRMDAMTARQWIPCSVLFSFNLFSSMKALQILPVSTFTILRNFQPCVTALIERFGLGKRMEWTEAGAIVGLTMGSVLFYAGDLTFSLDGYIWTSLHVASMTTYLFLVKVVSEREDLTPATMSIYNNALSLPLLL
ncbi:hypothetical protein T484DRAFT_1648707, partial [Baffinella frigidus]